MSLDGGPAAVAATAHKMGIEADLSTSAAKYSVGGGPFEPYNPALILGGLETGVSPLEMAHAYLTLQHNGQLVSGTMADSPTDPVAINKVSDAPPGDGGDLIEPNDGGPGYDKVETKQVISPTVAATARTILHTVVTSGTGSNAYTGDPTEWGKTGTTENNGDAWFVGANQDITIAIWVGHADSLKPMLTEYGGAPVDGGTIPALIFNEVVSAYELLKDEEDPGKPPKALGALRDAHHPRSEHPLGSGDRGSIHGERAVGPGALVRHRSQSQAPSQPQSTGPPPSAGSAGPRPAARRPPAGSPARRTPPRAAGARGTRCPPRRIATAAPWRG